jgi:hypothetical protein
MLPFQLDCFWNRILHSCLFIWNRVADKMSLFETRAELFLLSIKFVIKNIQLKLSLLLWISDATRLSIDEAIACEFDVPVLKFINSWWILSLICGLGSSILFIVLTYGSCCWWISWRNARLIDSLKNFEK